jgi:hypothetical protein
MLRSLIYWHEKLTRLGVEPRPSGYIPGALPLSYLAMGYGAGFTSLSLVSCLSEGKLYKW